MARKKPDLNIFAKTEQPTTQPEPVEDPVKPRGIGLRTSEWKRFDEIARELGMKRHALALWVVRDFMRRYDAGEIQTQTRRTLPGA